MVGHGGSVAVMVGHDAGVIVVHIGSYHVDM